MVKTTYMTALALGAAVTLTAPVQAATVVDLNNQTSIFGGSNSGNAFRYTTTLNGEQINLQVTAWTIKSDNSVVSSRLVEYDGGLGVINSNGDDNTPEHTVDNENWYDFLLFQFDTAVDLDGYSIGWAYNDTDASIRYGNLATPWNTLPSANPLGATAASLNDFLPNTLNVMGNASIGDRIIPGTAAANTWLISALNPVELGTQTQCSKPKRGSKHGSSHGQTCSEVSVPGYDYFKVNGITFSAAPPPTPPVPEPASWMMMIGGIGMAGAAMRRRKKPSIRFDFASA